MFPGLTVQTNPDSQESLWNKKRGLECIQTASNACAFKACMDTNKPQDLQEGYRGWRRWRGAWPEAWRPEEWRARPYYY